MREIIRTGFATLAIAVVASLSSAGNVSAQDIAVTPETITAQIQTAQPGDTLRLADGNYGSIVIDKPLTIFGDSDGVVMYRATIESNNVTIEGIDFVGDGADGVNAIELRAGQNIRISNNDFSGYHAGVNGYVQGINNLDILRNDFANMAEFDVFVQGSGNDVYLTANRFSSNTQVRGIDSANLLNDVTYFRNNWKLGNAGTPAGNGVTGMYTDGLNIDVNTFELADGAVMSLNPISIAGGVSNAEITDNRIIGAALPIRLYAYSANEPANSDITITGNTIAGNGMEAGIPGILPDMNYSGAVTIQGSTNNVTIEGNKISNILVGTAIEASAGAERNSNITIGVNTYEGLYCGLYVQKDAIPDDQKITVRDANLQSVGEKGIWDVENNDQIVYETDDNQNANPEQPDDKPVIEAPDVTEPVATDNQDAADITAPNTGAKSFWVMSMMVVLGVIVAIAVAASATRFVTNRR